MLLGLVTGTAVLLLSGSSPVDEGHGHAGEKLGKVEFPTAVRSTPVVANGVLYVMTENAVYAFGKKD